MKSSQFLRSVVNIFNVNFGKQLFVFFKFRYRIEVRFKPNPK